MPVGERAASCRPKFIGGTLKIAVIGCGYLGAVHAASMAELGHTVIGYDIDDARIDALTEGQAPFVEPELDGLLERHVHRRTLTFSTDPSSIGGAEVFFICVGTPQRTDSMSADLSALRSALDTVLAHGSGGLIVGKSTVPVGTAREIHEELKEGEKNFSLIWNPEFLREGFAVNDTLSPDRIVYGVPSENGETDDSVTQILDQVYAEILTPTRPRLVMDFETAEMVKVAANSFLATKISFINAMAELCERTGADVTRLAEAIGLDDRIGSNFLRAGIGFGGGCLPKDIRAFMARAGELGAPDSLSFLREIDSINARARERAVRHVTEAAGGDLTGSVIAILGASFKPNSDDIRDSPSLGVANALASSGGRVRVYDPVAGDRVRATHPILEVVTSRNDALREADVVFLGTEWDEFRNMDPRTIADVVAKRSIVDGRNVLDPDAWRAAGWTYRGLGR